MIDILKMDIQGGELLALKGAQSLLEASRIRLLALEVEFKPLYKDQPLFWDICAYLYRFGYSCMTRCITPRTKTCCAGATQSFLHQNSLVLDLDGFQKDHLHRGVLWLHFATLKARWTRDGGLPYAQPRVTRPLTLFSIPIACSSSQYQTPSQGCHRLLQAQIYVDQFNNNTAVRGALLLHSSGLEGSSQTL